MIKSRANALVFLACVLIAMCLSGPAMELLDKFISRHPVHPPTLVGNLLMAPLAIVWFLDYALGKVFAAILSVCVLIVVIHREIRWWTKVILVLATAAVWRVLPPWIERSNHLW